MGATDNTKRVSTITHTYLTMAEPVGGSIAENMVWGENRPSIRVSAALWLEAYALRAIAEFQGLVTPGTAGAKATLTYTLEKISGSTGTIAISNMRRSSNSWNLSSAPHRQAGEFVYDAADSEALNPITVSM